MSDGESLLLHVDVQTDEERGRVVMSISRSDTGAVLRGLLTAAQARAVAHQLLHCSLQVD